MTVEASTPTETYPWDTPTREPSAVYQSTDRLQATIFLRPTTPIETFDRPHPDALNGDRVVGIHLGDLTIQFPAFDGDAGILATTDELIDVLGVLRDAAVRRLSAPQPTADDVRGIPA